MPFRTYINFSNRLLAPVSFLLVVRRFQNFIAITRPCCYSRHTVSSPSPAPSFFQSFNCHLIWMPQYAFSSRFLVPVICRLHLRNAGSRSPLLTLVPILIPLSCLRHSPPLSLARSQLGPLFSFSSFVSASVPFTPPQPLQSYFHCQFKTSVAVIVSTYHTGSTQTPLQIATQSTLQPLLLAQSPPLAPIPSSLPKQPLSQPPPQSMFISLSQRIGWFYKIVAPYLDLS